MTPTDPAVDSRPGLRSLRSRIPALYTAPILLLMLLVIRVAPPALGSPGAPKNAAGWLELAHTVQAGIAGGLLLVTLALGLTGWCLVPRRPGTTVAIVTALASLVLVPSGLYSVVIGLAWRACRSDPIDALSAKGLSVLLVMGQGAFLLALIGTLALAVALLSLAWGRGSERSAAQLGESLHHLRFLLGAVCLGSAISITGLFVAALAGLT